MSVSSRRPARWLALLAASSIAAVGLIAAPASALAPSASISPTTAAPNTITSFTVTVSAVPGSTAAETVTITVPAGFSSPSLDPSWTRPEAGWTVSGPVAGKYTFTAPSSGAKLNASESLVASISAVTPSAAGSYTWVVGGTTNGTNPIGDFVSPSVTIGVVKQNQTITFDAIDDQTFGTGPLSLAATASSGLAVTYSTSGDCAVSGAQLTLTAAGSCSVTAQQAGNSGYNAAPDVTRTFAINKASQTITFDAIDTQTYGTGPLTLAATGGGSGNAVTFTATGECTASGTSLTLDGAGSCTVTAHQAGNTNYLAADDVSRTFTINKAEATLELSGLSHTYDGQSHGAAVTTTPLGLGTVTVTYDGATQEPTAAGSYAVHASLDNPDYSGEVDGTLVIDPKHVTGTFTVADKEYDGTTAAVVTGCSVSGIEAVDTDVDIDCTGATAAFDGAAAGLHDASLTGAVLTGAGSENYVLDGVDPTTGTIEQRVVTATLQAGDKVYDGTDTASATATLDNVVAGEGPAVIDVQVVSATFADENAGDSKTVTATVELTGTGRTNYVLASTTVTDTASINALHVTGTFTAADKVYDGTNAATVTGRALVGVIELAGVPDDVALSGGTATFADENAGNGKVVTLTGAGLSGSDAGNYVLDSVADTNAAIDRRSVSPIFTAADKVWDGNTSATITSRDLAAAAGDTGKIAGDDVVLTDGTATFADANVGTGKTVTAIGFTLGGTEAGNYQLAAGPWTTTASIQPLYSGTGFYAPVDMPTTTSPIVWNTLKGGQTVPLKFEVFSTQSGHAEQTALTIFGATATDQARAFSAQVVNCSSGASISEDAIEVVTTGGTSLRYDTTAGQFIQNWKTPTTGNTCYKVTVKTVDGSVVGPAYFWVKK